MSRRVSSTLTSNCRQPGSSVARAARVVQHQRQESIELPRVDRELDGDDVHVFAPQLGKAVSMSAICAGVSIDTGRVPSSSASFAVCSSSSALSTASSSDLPATTGP